MAVPCSRSASPWRFDGRMNVLECAAPQALAAIRQQPLRPPRANSIGLCLTLRAQLVSIAASCRHGAADNEFCRNLQKLKIALKQRSHVVPMNFTRPSVKGNRT